MAELKKNHYIPRFILNYWKIEGDKYPGAHTYEISKDRKVFSSAKGRSAYSFATVNDLYVPFIGSGRNTNMEKWFSGLESPLASFVRQVHSKVDPIQFKSHNDLTKFQMGIEGLNYRSRYMIERIKEVVESSPEIKSYISANPERSTDQVTLENIVHLVTEMALRFTPMELKIIVSEREKSFITCDRPSFIQESFDHRFVVLTNKVMLAYKKSTVGFQYRYEAAKDGFIDEMNSQIAYEARDWIVADSEELLEKYIRVVKSDEWKKRASSDKIEFIPIERLTSGYSFPGSE